MDQTDFTYVLQHPQEITLQQTEAVKSIINEFPYFQSARAIYLKGLKDQSSLEYNQELKITAAHTTDRSILFDFITSEAFVQNEISQFIKQNTAHLKDFNVTIEDLSVEKSVTIDYALKQQIKDTDGVLDPALFQPKEARPKKVSTFVLDESESIEDLKTKPQDASADDILNLGQPLQFDKRESHSFGEWLKLTRYKPIKRIQEKENKPIEIKTSETLEKEKKFELIDKFISENPKISPAKPLNKKGNLAKAQMIQPEALMTETLARIYVEQKNYKKAIQSYKILSLKYPEKSGFFANQIKAVEQLQEQNNKE
ncbi:tetratricopeptide repeat protein [Flaviramulus aquimarinus]|uniref:Tetratricopeptide repeat protein n=1 Tax=Flaviramulus aquimarinus TaxID=1170456 RepID=A0ABP9F4J0_9FLAO